MADEAFALSPISARAAQPSDEDYAAISEAFMETSRGRWFLTEYAKRNRNADTRMVLDAVERIEKSLAAQKEEGLRQEAALHREQALAAQQHATAAAAATEAAESRLAEALGAVNGAVGAAQESAVEALDSLALEQRLAPVRKGARVIREIAWRLREIGNDGRICDLIDSQVAVIEKATEQITPDEARAALAAAFAALEGRLAALEGRDRAPAPGVAAEAPAPPPAPQEVAAAEMPEAVDTMAVDAVAEAAPSAELATTVEPALVETAFAEAEAPSAMEIMTETAEAEDDAVLDIIAMEMGAPDPIDDNEIAAEAIEAAQLDEFAPAMADIEALVPEPAPVEPVVRQSVAPVVEEAIQPLPQPVAQAEPAPAMEVSLGSTIIASGMLRKPATAANDPLASIRRMSQAEKIAFFS
ncbi:MAG: hypothetical protein PS018_09615 [bacterium]|nr:hypothetical protein [bacterium]